MEFPNIQYNGDVSKFVEDKNDPTEVISLYKDSDYFQDERNYDKFWEFLDSNDLDYIENKDRDSLFATVEPAKLDLYSIVYQLG